MSTASCPVPPREGSSIASAGSRAALLACALLAPLASCAPRPSVLASEAHLLETGIVGAAGVVERQAIHGDDRRSLKLVPPATARFRARVPPGALLSFGIAARPVDVALSLRIEDASGRRLHDESLRTGAAWSERRVDLAPLAGREAEIRIRVEGRADMVALGEPKIIAPRAAPDNVLVYVVDCLRADRVGAMGYARPTTPALDRFAAGAFVFERAYACAAWTKPSVGCLFTGLYPVRHGARNVDHALDPERATLAERLRREGYATAAVVANPVLDGRGFGFARGFDRYLELAREWKNRNVNSTPADAALVTDTALHWIGEHTDRPFFLYVHSIDLHYPYLARAGFEGLVRAGRSGLERDSDLYDSELAYTDRELGRLLDGLRRLQLDQRTTILVTADHGEEFGEHGSARHGHTLFDTLLHVPMILKLAGGTDGRRIEDSVAQVDVMPTLLELARAPAPPGLDGVSLVPAVRGRSLPPRALFAEQLSPREVLYAVRHGRHKLVRQLLPIPGEWLFDLGQDADEMRSLVDSEPGQASQLASLLLPFLLQGQEGLHIVMKDPAPGNAVRVGLTSGARIADVARLNFRTGDTLEIDAGGRSASLHFVSGGARRHVIVRTEPPGADVTLELGPDFAPFDLRLGSKGEPATRLPMPLSPAALRVAVPPADMEGARAWAFAVLSERRPEVVSPELQEQMRALGYLQ
ncbi:MAG TPA: sulfatase [Vicinamibacteria bacterium]|nr:sulfatase [Vicinamibacteria bacterium]